MNECHLRDFLIGIPSIFIANFTLFGEIYSLNPGDSTVTDVRR